MLNIENQQEKLTLECYLQLKQSQKLISEKFFKSKSKYFQDLPEIYYQLTSINVLIPLIHLDLDDLESSTLEALILKIAQDPHRSWVTFLWIVPEGYQEDFEAYLGFIDPELGNSSQKDYHMQVLDLPTLQHCWLSIDTRIDAYWDISPIIDHEFMCWNPEDQYADCLMNLPKIFWSDDRPVTACLYESLLQKIEQLDRQASQAFSQSNWGEAINLYETIVSLNPLNPNNWSNLGSSHFKQGNYQEAKDCLEQAIVLNPNEQQHRNTLGLIYEKLQHYEQAIATYKNAIRIAPKEGISYCNLGNLFIQLSQYLEAERIYQEGLAANSWYYGLYLNLGNLWVLMGKNTEAIQVYKKAEYFASNADLYFNLSIAYQQNDPLLAQYYYATSLKQQGKHHEALSIYENIIQTNPLYPSQYEPEIHINYLDCLKALGYEERFVEIIKNVIALFINKNISEINVFFVFRLYSFFNRKGEHYKSQVLAKELKIFSISAFNDLFVQLNFPVLYNTESEILTHRKNFTNAIEKVSNISIENSNTVEEGYALIKTLLNFYPPYQNFNDLNIQHKISRFINKILTLKYPKLSNNISSNDKNRTSLKKIRVGYLSNHFQSHSATMGTLGWFANHNPDKFEYFVYHIGSLDTTTQIFAEKAEYFHHISVKDFIDLEEWFNTITETIQSDNLDILIFTDVGMDIESILLSRLRLAPIQCVSWGHPVTTGSETIDYFLTVHLMEPSDAYHHYSEKLVYLPNISWSYPDLALPENRKSRSDFELPTDRILYFSCQSLFKYLPQYDYIYPAIAERVPQAFFMFLDIFEVGSIFWQRLQKVFAAVDLDVNNFCKILPRQSPDNFFELQGLSDIYLDTLTWSGGNTTLQALAWPIPVVTCPNQFMRGRHSYGILQTLGVTETIAHNEAEYIDIACELGLNSQWRSSIVEKIKAYNHRLYNDLQCVQAVETFFEYAYEKYQDDMIQQS